MRKFFYGFIFLFLDFSMQLEGGHSIGLLPNFVGMILLLLGFRELSGETDRYARQQSLSIGALALSLAIWVLKLIGGMPSALTIVLDVLFTVMALYLTYQVVRGFGDIGERRMLDLESKKALVTWKLLAALQIANLAFGWVPVLNIILMLALLVVVVMMLMAVRRAGNVYLLAVQGPRGGIPGNNG